MSGKVLRYDDPLIRQQWITEGLIQAASRSYFAPLTGTSKSSVIYQSNNFMAGKGDTVTFDYSGNMAVRAVKGKEKARGTGEREQRFYSKLDVERYRLVAYIEDEFDASQIGDLTSSVSTKAKNLLADAYIRWKDQLFFDTMQGLHSNDRQTDPTPTHTIDFDDFDIGELEEIELTLKTGVGFTTGGIRRPIEPFYLENGEPVWVLTIDAYLAKKLKTSPNYTSIMTNADVRGNNNRVIRGVIGKIGHLLIREAPLFMGEVVQDTPVWGADAYKAEIAGLHIYDKTNDRWSGQEGFDFGAELYSRAYIAGANAVQFANGKAPDYRFEMSDDFAIDGEVALIVYQEAQRTRLKASSNDYYMAKVADMDANIVNLNIKH